MAARNSTSKARPGRNSVPPPTKARPVRKVSSGPAHNSPSNTMPEALEDAIEDERARLMTAHSVLSCVTLAMEGDDGGGKDGPYYPGLIGIARDLVNESIKRMDSNKLERLMTTTK